jgi:hypothetical protein
LNDSDGRRPDLLDHRVHQQSRARQVVAQLMGHANVDTLLNVHTQVLDGSLLNGRRLGVVRGFRSTLFIEASAASA